MKWDKGIDFLYAYGLLTRELKKNKRVGVCHTAILLIQLRNGARISEAVRAFKAFILNGSRELEVNVSKKRKPEMRLMVIPTELTDEIRVRCAHLASVDDRTLKLRTANWCRRFLRLNTHSLRYAFVTHMLRSGVNPAVVAKILRHSDLSQILTYTQVKEAENVLKSL